MESNSPAIINELEMIKSYIYIKKRVYIFVKHNRFQIKHTQYIKRKNMKKQTNSISKAAIIIDKQRNIS